jgi:hypothetical protein
MDQEYFGLTDMFGQFATALLSLSGTLQITRDSHVFDFDNPNENKTRRLTFQTSEHRIMPLSCSHHFLIYSVGGCTVNNLEEG